MKKMVIMLHNYGFNLLKSIIENCLIEQNTLLYINK